jgi:hypothetical protein
MALYAMLALPARTVNAATLIVAVAGVPAAAE